MKESRIQNKIVEYCSTINLTTIKLTILGRRGIPDLLILGPNKFVMFIEVKTPTGSLSEIQKYFIVRLRRLGFHVAVPRSFEEAKSAIDLELGNANKKQTVF